MEFYSNIMKKNGVNTEAMTWSQMEAVAKAMKECADIVVGNLNVTLD